MEGLRLENKALKDRVDTHEQERLSVEESSRKNKDQLHDMAQMVSSPLLGEGRYSAMGVPNQYLQVAKDITLTFSCPYFTHRSFSC